MNYEYWETPEEKEERLRLLWIESKQKTLNNLELSNEINTKENLDMPKDKISLEESIESLSNILTKQMRDLRFKIDQHLLKGNKHPMFGSNYKYYKGRDFLLDAEHEFHKIKKFLKNDQDIIKADPEIGYRYGEVLENLKRKKVMENTYTEHYSERAYSQLSGKMFDIEEDQYEEDDNEFKRFERKSFSDANLLTERINTEHLVASKENKKVENQIGKFREKILTSFETAIGAVQPKKDVKGKGVTKSAEGKAPKINTTKKRNIK
jgi:mRNA-degrading endonuclease YafQ of YafQ-DinJ toxin-antitoxin module